MAVFVSQYRYPIIEIMIMLLQILAMVNIRSHLTDSLGQGTTYRQWRN